MDSSDNTRPQLSGSPFREAIFANSATSPSDTLLVVIPDFSLDQTFGDPDGVIWTPLGSALPQEGDRALVAESADGTWWVISWWSDSQSTEAGPEATHYVGDAGDPVAPSFTNSWVNYDNSLAAPSTPRARSVGFYKHNGRVWLSGVMKTGASGSVAFTLPTGYRPPHDSWDMLTLAGGSTGSISAMADGRIIPTSIAGNVATYVELFGLSFRHA